MYLPTDIVEYLFLVAIFAGAIGDYVLRRRRIKRYQIPLRIGLAGMLIGYGLYIGTVWPFAVIVAMGVVGHLQEKWESREQIQRLRDLYR